MNGQSGDMLSTGAQNWVGDPSRVVSVEDRLAVQELTARYAHYVDNGLGEAWASTFTPDGVLEYHGIPVCGHEELAAFASQDLGFYPTHFVGNSIMVQVAPDLIHARSMVVVAIRSKNEAPVVVHDMTIDAPTETLGVGVYDDEIVKTEQGWRFRFRRAGSTGVAPVHPDFLPAGLVG